VNGLVQAEGGAADGVVSSDFRRLELGSGILDVLELCCRAAGNLEACALLIGERRGHRIVAVECEPAANVAADPRGAFEVDPGAVVAGCERARRAGLGLIGVWHSHPSGPAFPSRRDLEELWPGWVLLISAGGDPGVMPRAFVSAASGLRHVGQGPAAFALEVYVTDIGRVDHHDQIRDDRLEASDLPGGRLDGAVGPPKPSVGVDRQ